MQIFLHTRTGLTIEAVDETTTIAAVADAVGIGDAIGWLEDIDEPLKLTDKVGKVVGDNGHLFLGRCRRIEVTVNFAGRTKMHRFAPGTTIGRVRHWAVGVDGFDLPQKERPKHEVGLCGTGAIADRNDHIGTIATDCTFCLDLAPKDRFQG